MKQLPKSLQQKLQQREANNALRKLPMHNDLVDFASNDYLGFAKNEAVFDLSHQLLINQKLKINGATGSRLLSGNYNLHKETESYIARFHGTESALIFNSGYDANLGVLSAIPQRNDIIFYDELCHASIRDGIQLSKAKSYKFKHNDLENLEKLITKFKIHNTTSVTYIITESVFSMDGDSPNLEKLSVLCEKHQCYLIVDEAHALGVFGTQGSGVVQQLNLQDKVFARIITFGKALGCHGAVVVGSELLKSYLINYARSFIYTTALSPHSIATIYIAYQHLNSEKEQIKKLNENIIFFNEEINAVGLKHLFIASNSPIQCAVIPSNEKAKKVSQYLQSKGFDVKPILSPTVPKGQERLRFCLHSFNSYEEITKVLQLLSASLHS
ncbi:aminotransferase class I/II-fold pyridoxal phosphate-dependent enzyme [Flavobacterium croceum]|uniref:aminotransferase class I/II-fold pyridoxal phosphate-dependent enzyme n=1 Tax=Flavobacterium croceum TaxID=370975 RepID=UPI0024A926AA|nr:pyridoxal phosphate-dependent aminotransferase family protein [Flavobacterium croceum]